MVENLPNMKCLCIAHKPYAPYWQIMKNGIYYLDLFYIIDLILFFGNKFVKKKMM